MSAPSPATTARRCLVLCLAGSLWGCGGGDGGSAPAPPPSYTVGGTVSGLGGGSLVLRLNGTTDLTISTNGTFAFAASISSGSPYAVTVQAQPNTLPAQICNIADGSGFIAAAVTNIAVTCRNMVARFIYVPLQGLIAGFSIDAAHGILSPIPGSPFPGTGVTSATLLVHPSGRLLYAAGAAAGTINGTLMGFAIDQSTGSLIPLAGMPINIPTANALRYRIHPSGNFLVHGATNVVGPGSPPASSGLFVFAINTTNGALTAVSGSPFFPMSNGSFNDIEFDNSGAYLHAAVVGTANNIQSYSFNDTSGALGLSGVVSAPVQAGNFGDVVVTATHLYAATLAPTVPASNMIFAYNIGASGLGTAVAGSPFPAGQFPVQMLRNAASTRLFVLNTGVATPADVPASVSSYVIDATTGALTLTAGSPVTTNFIRPSLMSLSATERSITLPATSAGQIGLFTVAGSTGVIAQHPSSPLTPSIGTTPLSVAHDPSGRYLYVVDQQTRSVAAYLINPSTDNISLIFGGLFNATPIGPAALVGLH